MACTFVVFIMLAIRTRRLSMSIGSDDGVCLADALGEMLTVEKVGFRTLCKIVACSMAYSRVSVCRRRTSRLVLGSRPWL